MMRLFVRLWAKMLLAVLLEAVVVRVAVLPYVEQGLAGAILALAILVGVSLGAALVAWPLGRRMGRLSRTARALAAGDLTARVDVESTDPVGHLEATFNAMAGEIQRLIAAHGDLRRRVSHELRTPMQRLHLSLEMAAHAADTAERERRFERMATDLEALDELIEELLSHSRLEKRFALEKQPIDAADAE